MSGQLNNKNKEIELPESTEENVEFNTDSNEGHTLEKITPRKKTEIVQEEAEEIEFVARTLVIDASQLLKELKSSGPQESSEAKEKPKEVQVISKPKEIPRAEIGTPTAKVSPTPTSTPALKSTNISPVKSEITNPNFFIDPKLKYPSHLDREPLNQMQQIEVNAKIKIAMAEAKTFVVAEAAAKSALLEFQINQVLSKIYQKYPDTKIEIIKIQKLLNTHSKIKETDGTKEN